MWCNVLSSKKRTVFLHPYMVSDGGSHEYHQPCTHNHDYIRKTPWVKLLALHIHVWLHPTIWMYTKMSDRATLFCHTKTFVWSGHLSTQQGCQIHLSIPAHSWRWLGNQGVWCFHYVPYSLWQVLIQIFEGYYSACSGSLQSTLLRITEAAKGIGNSSIPSTRLTVQNIVIK